MTYTPRWDRGYDQFIRNGPERDLPWVQELERARNEADLKARGMTLKAHEDEYYRHFDEEMDRRHAEIVATWGGELQRFRESPEVWLVPPPPRV